MKKGLSLSVALLMLLGCFAACTPTDTPQEQPTEQETTMMDAENKETTVQQTETETEKETEETVPDTGYPIDLMMIGETAFSAFDLYVQPSAAKGITDAVDLLVEYAEKATGHKLSLCQGQPGEHTIVIGQTDFDSEAVKTARSQIKHDGYAIVEDNGRLYISGSCTAGTVYGVYTFMENFLGVRFYTEDYTYVRDNPIIRIPAGYCEVYSPAFMMRDSFWYDVSQSQTLANRLKDNSGYIADLEGGISYAGNFVHTLAALSGTAHEIGKQPCLTDENVYKTVLANVKAWLRAHPQAKIVSVSQNDSAAEHLGCQCANCKAIDEREGTPMGSLLTFVNRIANDIKDEFPGVYVDTLAYRYTRQAPKTIKPADNVIIRLCSIECCFGHALSDESCERNAAFKKDIEEWSAICKNLYIWDYTTNFMFYLAPFPNLGVLRENVKFYKDHNVIGMFEQGNYQSTSGEFGELRAYLLAKLLWNPDMSEEEYSRHMNEFLQDYYGAGWENIRTYIDKTSEAATFNHVGIYDQIRIMMLKHLGKNGEVEFTREMLALWEQALALAETEEHKAHIEKSMIQVYYMCQERGKAMDRREYFAKVYELCEKYGITHYREGTPIDYSQKDKMGSLG